MKQNPLCARRILRAEAERVLGTALSVSCSLNVVLRMHGTGGWKSLSLPFVFVTPEKKVDLSETFRPCRCLGFIFMLCLQGNSKREVKQEAESRERLY